MPLPTPKVGTVDDGYRFAGGVASDPKNWKKIPPKKGAVEDGFRFVGKDPSDPNSWSDVDQEGGFWSSIFDRAQTLGLADEAAAFTANPSEKTRRAFVAAGNSKYRGVNFGEGADWVAFKQALGGSIGDALAPLAAGIGTSFVGTPIAGLAAASATSGAQYTTQNLLRQAQEQERAIAEGKAPEETSISKALVAAAGQTGLEVVGGRAFSGIAKLFPFARPLLGLGGKKAAQEAGEVIADAAEKGTLSFVKGVATGTGKGVAFEIPQELAQTTLERWQAGLSLSDDEAFGEYKQAAIGAALLGGGFGAVSGGLESRSPDTSLKPADVKDTPLGNIPSEMLDSVEKEVITTPEDRAEYDELVTRLSVSSGIPEEEAKRYALSTIAERKKAERAQRAREAGVDEEVEAEDGAEEVQQVEPKVATDEEVEAAIPDIQQMFDDAGIDFEDAYGVTELDDVQKAQAARIIVESPEVDAYDAIDSVLKRGIETPADTQPIPNVAPDIQPTADAGPILSPIQEAAPAIEPVADIQPTADAAPTLTPIQEAAPTVEPAPLTAVYDAPNMAGRIAAAKPIVSSIIESIPGMVDVKVPTKLVNAAARQIAQLAANQQTFNPVQIVTDALAASGVTPNPVEAAPNVDEAAPAPTAAPAFTEPTLATEQAAPSVDEVAPAPDAVPAVEPEFAEPQFAQVAPTEETVTGAQAAPVQEVVQEAAPEEEVVVTKVAPGAASGAKPAKRGVQGNVSGRPVEGATAVTAGMQEEQELNKRLRIMRNNGLISDQDVGKVMNLIRVPESAEALNAMPESQKARWVEVLSLSRDMNEKAEQRDAAKGKKKKELNDAVKAIDNMLDEMRGKLAKYAMGDAAIRVAKRKMVRKQIETDFKAGKISKVERDRKRSEMRVERPIAEFMQEGALSNAVDPEEAAFVEAGLESKSFEEAVQWVINNAPDEAYRTIAKSVQRGMNTLKLVGWAFDFKITHIGDRIPSSLLSASGLTRTTFGARNVKVWLNGADVTGRVGTTFETFLHEAVHAVTMTLVKAGNLKRFEDTKFGKAVGDLFDVYNHVVRGFNANVRSGAKLSPIEEAIYKSTNTLRNPDEILAWTMSNREVMEYLDTIYYKPNQSVFGRIVEIVRNVLGLAKNLDSALAEVLRAGEAILNTSVEEAAMASDYYTEKTAAAISPQIKAGSKPKAKKPKEKIDRGLYKAQMSNTATGLTEGIDEAVAGAEITGKEKRRAMKEALEATTAPGMLAFYPTSAIRKGISNRLPGLGSIINGIDRLEQNMRGMRTSMRTALSRRVREFEDFVNKSGQGVIATTMTIARVNRVDLTAYANRAEALANDPVIRFEKARNNAKGVTKREKAVNTAWDAWDALGKQPGGHDLYKKVRQFYKDMHIALRAAQDQDIRNLGLDKKATDKLIQEARGDLDVDEDAVTDKDADNPGVPEKLFPKEYFPFRRFGKYALVVKDGKRAERERYHFDTAKERNLFEVQVAKKLGIQRGTTRYGETFRQLNVLENLRDDVANNESTMLKRMFKVIDDARLEAGDANGDGTIADESLKNKLYQTYLLTLPERSLQKQLIHAKLVPGQSADVLNVFRTAVAQYSSQLPKVVYGGQIQKQIEAAYDSISNEMDPAERAKVTSLVDAFVKRVRATNDAESYGWKEQFISSFTFLSLMTSIASAAVQPLTLPFQVMPRMFARYGFKDTFAAVGKYTPVFSLVEASVDVDPITGARTLVAPTIGNTTFIKSNPLRARLWNELNLKRDLFSQKQTDMLLRDRPTKSTSRDTVGQKLSGAYETTVDKAGAIFSSADQITREVSGMSYAELEYNRLIKAGKSHEEAIEGAVEVAVNNTNETIGNYTELEKLGVFRGDPLRRMIGFLRTYSVQRTAYYFRMLKALVKEDPTQTKLQAFNELSMVIAFTSAAAGLSANFGYTFITSALDIIIPALLGDDEMEEWRKQDPLGADDADYRFRFGWLPQNFGPDSTAVRVMQKGLLSELTGWDWSTRLSQSQLWLREGRGGETTKDEIINFFIANLAPQVSQSANMLDGVDDFSRGEYSKGFSKLVPAAVRGAFTAERQAREGDTTKTNKIVRGSGEFTPLELFGQVLGFTPDELSRLREINRTTNQWQRSMKDERGELFQEFRSVYGDGDEEALEVVFEKMRRFNAKVPLGSNGQPLGKYLIEGEDLERSLQSAETLEEKSYRGVEYNDGEEELFFPYESRKRVVE